MTATTGSGSAPPERGSTSIALLDDHVVVRQGLRTLLEREDDFEVIGEAGTIGEFLGLDLAPDVIVADLILPDGRGAEVVGRVAERFPHARILVLTMVNSPGDVHLTFAAGARGFMLKEAAATDLVDAVRKVAAGESYILPSLGAALAKYGASPPGAQVTAEDPLTEREREVLRLIALGHTNAEISSVMHVSLRTVESHRSHIYDKLGIRNRAGLVRYASEAGLTPEGGSAGS